MMRWMPVRVWQNCRANASTEIATAMLLENLPLRLGLQGLVNLREDRHARAIQFRIA